MITLSWKLKSGSLLIVAGLMMALSAMAQTASTTETPQTTCSNGGGKWCINSDLTTGWCSYSTTPCPAYDTASCAAQSGEWCLYYGNTGVTGGYCNSTPGTCPIYSQADCEAKSRSWCAGTNGAMGWCATTGSTCPANDATSCAAQNGEWCTYSGGASGGYCNSVPGTCPINDKATCESKSRSWCTSSYGGGWCASTGSSCPADSSSSGSSSTSGGSSGSGTTYTSFNWPNTEADCTKYQGVWCASTYSTSMYTGSCNMAGMKCPVTPPAGMTTCWDNTFASSWSACPAMPSNQTDCTAKGYNWCSSMTTYSGASSGWCSNMACSKMPPSGQMVCPDNQTFATTLSGCPTAAAQVVVVEPAVKTCTDGTVVSITSECPRYTTCSDGTKVPEGTTCPVKTEDPSTLCLNKGGKWCFDSNGMSGYCTMTGSCTITVTSTAATVRNVEVVPLPKVLTESQSRLVEQKKKEYLKRLELLEKVFTKYSDSGSLEKTKILKEKISFLPPDSNALDTLEIIKDDIVTLMDIRDELIMQGGSFSEETFSAREKQMQAKALAQMKKSLATLDRRLVLIENKALRLEKQGFIIPASLKDLINKVQDLVNTVKNAETFDQARDAADSLSDNFEDINTWIPRLEQLAQITRLYKTIGLEITKTEKNYARIAAQVKKLKVNFEAPLVEVKAMIESARAAFSSLKTADYSDVEPFEVIQSDIIEKLEDANDGLFNIQSLAGLKGSVNQLSARIARYEARINRLAKQKKNVTEMKSMLSDLKDGRDTLKQFATTKLAELDIAQALEVWKSIDTTSAELEDLLSLSAPSPLEKELRKGMITQDLLKINIPETEKQVIRAYRVATFFQRNSLNLAEYSSYGNKSNVSKWRNQLAIDN